MNSAKLKDSAMKNIDIKSLVVKEALAKKNIKILLNQLFI